MPTISISAEAYKRLKKRKEAGDSFSDVILREVPELSRTTGDVLDASERTGVPKANSKLRKAMLAGRGRRPPRQR